jgi:lipopolysaccharide assembly protein A
MRILVWLLRAFIFFTLFAFALNNQQTATVNWFFGVQWQAPMVIVVLVAFAAGCVIGVLAMVPGWWAPAPARRQARRGAAGTPLPAAAASGPRRAPAASAPPRPRPATRA